MKKPEIDYEWDLENPGKIFATKWMRWAEKVCILSDGANTEASWYLPVLNRAIAFGKAVILISDGSLVPDWDAERAKFILRKLKDRRKLYKRQEEFEKEHRAFENSKNN